MRQNNNAVNLHANSTLLFSFFVDFWQFSPYKFIPSFVSGIANLFLFPIFQFCDALLKLQKRREDYHCWWEEQSINTPINTLTRKEQEQDQKAKFQYLRCNLRISLTIKFSNARFSLINGHGGLSIWISLHHNITRQEVIKLYWPSLSSNRTSDLL